MTEYRKHGKVGKAALRSGMDRKTARKYLKVGKLPSELKKPRTWRTRPDPFEKDWPYVRELVSNDPDLEAKTIFEHLEERDPGRYQEGQLRTLQRRTHGRIVPHLVPATPQGLLFRPGRERRRVHRGVCRRISVHSDR